MINPTLLIDLIYKALKEVNNQTRAQAEQDLEALRKQNPSQFFLICAGLLRNPQNDQFVQVSAATILSRSFSLKESQGANYWDSLDQYCKSQIKNQLLGTLMCQRASVMRAGANTISYICAIEMVRNEWLELVGILVTNTTHYDPRVQIAAITTIGYICEQLKYSPGSINKQSCQQFCGAVINSLRSRELSVERAALVALRNSVHLFSPLLQNELVRDVFFEEALRHANGNDSVQEAYQVLFELCKSGYAFIGGYMRKMLLFLIPHLQKKDNNTILALELIDTIGSEYLDKIDDKQNRIGFNKEETPIDNILISVQGQLLPEVMRCLLIENQADLDFAELRNSAGKTLGTMVAVGDQITASSILSGVATVLQSRNDGERQAAAPLMSTLCEYPGKEIASKMINDGVQPICELLNSGELVVIANTLHGLALICEQFPELFYNRPRIGEYVDKFLSLLHANYENSVISMSIVNFLMSLTEGFNKCSHSVLLSDPTVMLTKMVHEFEIILENYRACNPQISEKIIAAIMNFLFYMRDQKTVYHMIEFLIGKYHTVYKSRLSNEEQEPILSYILIILQTSFYTLHQMQPEVQDVFTVITNHVKKFGIEVEGLMLIGAVVLSFKKNCKQKMEEYWAYIFQGLEMLDRPLVFRAGLQTLGDVARNFRGEHLQQYRRALKMLFSLLHESIYRDYRILIIETIGELFIGLESQGEQFIREVLEVFRLCFDAIYALQESPDEREYVEGLKFAVIEAESCVLFGSFAGFSRDNKPSIEEKYNRLADHYHLVFDFVKRTCDRRFNPAVEYVMKCLELLSDMAALLMQYERKRTMVVDSIDSPEIRDLVDALDRFSIRDDIRELQHLMRSQMN